MPVGRRRGWLLCGHLMELLRSALTETLGGFDRGGSGGDYVVVVSIPASLGHLVASAVDIVVVVAAAAAAAGVVVAVDAVMVGGATAASWPRRYLWCRHHVGEAPDAPSAAGAVPEVVAERRLHGSILGEVVLVLDELALAALGRAGLLLVAVEAVPAAPLAAGARVLAVALALHAVAGVAGRAEERRAAAAGAGAAGGVLLRARYRPIQSDPSQADTDIIGVGSSERKEEEEGGRGDKN